MPMKIHCSWKPADELPAYIGKTWAELRLEVGSAVVTRHTDTRNNDPLAPLDTIEAPAYPLACWFAENWWRLLYDVNAKRPTWEAAHNLIYAADGYLWPPLCCQCDERSMMLTGPQEEEEEKGNSIIHYFADLPLEGVRVPVEDFQSVIRRFIEGTIAQVRDSDRDLAQIWQAIREETDNKDYLLYRQIEARLGHAPNEAPEELVDSYIGAISQYGQQAVMDMASDGILAQVKSCRFGRQGEWSGPDLPLTKEPEAWKAGYAHAREVRHLLDISPGQPVDNQKLADLFRQTQGSLEKQWADDKCLSAGLLKREHNNHLSLYIGGSMRREDKRFMTARLAGAQLIGNAGESLLVCNDTNTWNQQYQRAFSAELLCPQEEVRNSYRGDFEKIAENFGVSSRVIEHQYKNALKEEYRAS